MKAEPYHSYHGMRLPGVDPKKFVAFTCLQIADPTLQHFSQKKCEECQYRERCKGKGAAPKEKN